MTFNWDFTASKAAFYFSLIEQIDSGRFLCQMGEICCQTIALCGLYGSLMVSAFNSRTSGPGEPWLETLCCVLRQDTLLLSVVLIMPSTYMYLGQHSRIKICSRHWLPACLQSWTEFSFAGKNHLRMQSTPVRRLNIHLQADGWSCSNSYMHTDTSGTHWNRSLTIVSCNTDLKQILLYQETNRRQLLRS